MKYADEFRRIAREALRGKWLLAVIAGVIIGLLVPKLNQVKQKTFVKEDFQIVLTEDFSEEALEGFFAVYTSKSAMVFVVREDKFYFEEGTTLKQYNEMVMQANGREGIPTSETDRYISFEFTETPDDQTLYYFGFCMESEKAFWTVHFATPETNRDEYQETFWQWADSVVLTNS